MSNSSRKTRNTSAAQSAAIREAADERIERYASFGRHAYERRIAELDAEWDVERVLQTNASTLSLIGLALAITSSRKWLLLPLAVQTFLLQHAVQGWCPPLPILRRLGFRTMEEIQRERYALKALRGDFEGVSSSSELAIEAVE